MYLHIGLSVSLVHPLQWLPTLFSWESPRGRYKYLRSNLAKVLSYICTVAFLLLWANSGGDVLFVVMSPLESRACRRVIFQILTLIHIMGQYSFYSITIYCILRRVGRSSCNAPPSVTEWFMPSSHRQIDVPQIWGYQIWGQVLWWDKVGSFPSFGGFVILHLQHTGIYNVLLT